MLGPVTRRSPRAPPVVVGHGSSAIATPDAAQADEARQHAAVAVRQAAEERAHRRLERAGRRRTWPRSPPPRRRARRAAAARARRACRTSARRGSTIHIPVAIRGSRRPANTARIGVRGGALRSRACSSAHTSRPPASGADRGEHDLGADRRRGGAEHRAEQRADDRGAHRRADHLAAALARRGADQPAERARPRDRPTPRPWTKRATSSTTMLAANANAIEAAISSDRPTHDGRAHAEPRRQPAAGQRARAASRPDRPRRGSRRPSCSGRTRRRTSGAAGRSPRRTSRR